MARFNTGEPVVTVNEVGKGRVYFFGLLWRDVVQCLQLSKGFSAQRSYSNDFEPSAGAFLQFVRSVYIKSSRIAVWKSTVPDGYQSILIPTHDCDSRTAYEEMRYISDYENSLGLELYYFFTTHYYRDFSYLSAFYDGQGVENSSKQVAAGHTVGSHSIGHFPDFSNTARLPIVRTTQESYNARHDMEIRITTDGSIWTEVALSKEILETDFGNRYVPSVLDLLMNKHIPAVQEEADYSFSSCYGAGDVMTCFPFSGTERQ